jgi:heat shock protein HslJ
MKWSIVFSGALVLLFILLSSGCTDRQPAPEPTVTPAPTTIATLPVPSDLIRSWTLQTLGANGGTSILRPTGEITLKFKEDGTLTGYTGCNNYYAAVTVGTGMTDKGREMTVGQIGASEKYCQTLADQEGMYLAILQDAMAYSVNIDKLIITANDGSTLVFDETG